MPRIELVNSLKPAKRPKAGANSRTGGEAALDWRKWGGETKEGKRSGARSTTTALAKPRHRRRMGQTRSQNVNLWL